MSKLERDVLSVAKSNSDGFKNQDNKRAAAIAEVLKEVRANEVAINNDKADLQNVNASLYATRDEFDGKTDALAQTAQSSFDQRGDLLQGAMDDIMDVISAASDNTSAVKNLVYSTNAAAVKQLGLDIIASQNAVLMEVQTNVQSLNDMDRKVETLRADTLSSDIRLDQKIERVDGKLARTDKVVAALNASEYADTERLAQAISSLETTVDGNKEHTAKEIVTDRANIEVLHSKVEATETAWKFKTGTMDMAIASNHGEFNRIWTREKRASETADQDIQTDLDSVNQTLNDNKAAFDATVAMLKQQRKDQDTAFANYVTQTVRTITNLHTEKDRLQTMDLNTRKQEIETYVTNKTQEHEDACKTHADTNQANCEKTVKDNRKSAKDDHDTVTLYAKATNSALGTFRSTTEMYMDASTENRTEHGRRISVLEARADGLDQLNTNHSHIMSSLKMTHYADNKIPVYRWKVRFCAL